MKTILQILFSALLLQNAEPFFAQSKSDLIARVRNSDVSSVPAYIEFVKGKEPLHNAIKQWLIVTYKLDPKIDFVLLNQESDKLGFVHYRYQQLFDGFPIEAGRLVVHTKHGLVHSLNGVVFEQFGKVATTPQVKEQEALASALGYVHAEQYQWGKSDDLAYPEGTLVYTLENNKLKKGALHLAYRFDIYAVKPLSRAYIYVDAVTNKVINEQNRIHFIDVQGTANTVYSASQTITTDSYSGGYRLRESGRGNGIETYNLQEGLDYTQATDFVDSDNMWNNINAQQDQYATDAHWGSEKTYDFYWTRFNRNSIDNNGFKLKSYVHYDVEYANAFWDGDRMTYGDGGGNSGMNPLISVDIVGHEITHGLTEFSAGLIYAGESGGLNESFSDIFGNCIEHYAKPNAASWLLGNEIGYTIRSMQNPNTYNDPDTYHGQYWDPYEEVHNISGVQNFWFYLLSAGGSGTNDNGDNYSVTGIGIVNAAAIAYRNLTVYLTPNSNYSDARYYAIQSAIDLFGPCSPEVAATANAWYAVGVGGTYSNTVQSDFNTNFVSYCSVPATVNFTNNSSNGVNFLWDFGDGSSATSVSPSHTYSNYGTYTVKLITYGGSCGTDTLIKTAYIDIDSTNTCPVSIPLSGSVVQNACAGILSDDGGADGNYSANIIGASVTISPPGATQIILSFSSFDFEQDYDYLYIYAGPDNTYPLIGAYTGSLLPNGGTVTVNSGSVTVEQYTDTYIEKSGFLLGWQCSNNPVAPIANFIADTTLSCSGVVQFTDISTNSPISWLWNFGDGSTSTLQHPAHHYLADGVYTVSLQATNSVGANSYSRLDYVNVNSGFCNGIVMPGGSSAGTSQTSCFGVLYDNGGALNDYSDNTNSTVVIAPAGATQITLNFSSFEMENNYDFVEIYDGTIVAPNQLLGHYTGNTLPNGTGVVTFNTSSITILQHTDYSVVMPGFQMSWSCSTQPYIPNVNFTVDSTGSCSGLVHFYDQSSGVPTYWYWDFGDGATSTLQNPVHQYTADGWYDVSLYATNSAGTGTYYASNYVYVNEAICSAIVMPVTGSDLLTSCSGMLTDNGGVAGNYADNTAAMVTISPLGATQITLQFQQFEMESYYDSLYVYAGTTTSSPLVGGYSGYSLPGNGTLVVNSSSVTLKHVADYMVNYSGFVIQWSCDDTPNGVEENDNSEAQILLYPNPAESNITIVYTASGVNYSGIRVLSTVGQLLFEVTPEVQVNQYEQTIDISSLSNGVYFIELVGDKGIKTAKRFVVNR